jgi:hypothetical protein
MLDPDLELKSMRNQNTANEACIEYDTFTAVLGIRDILVRIRIPGSVPLTNESGSDSFLFGDFKDAKKNISFHIFSYNLVLPTGTLSSVLKIYFLLQFVWQALF